MMRAHLARLPIGRKLTILMMITSAVTLLMGGGLVLVYGLYSYRGTLVQELSTLTDAIGFNSTAALLFEDGDAAVTALEGFRAMPSVLHANLVDPQGGVLGSYPEGGGAIPIARIMPATVGHEFSGDHLVLYRPVQLDGDVIGGVHVEVQMGLWRRLGALIGLGAIVFVVCASVVLLLASRLQGVVSDPVIQLANTARRISREADYSVRARKVADDEIGELAEAFNGMLNVIQEQASRVEAANVELERLSMTDALTGLYNRRYVMNEFDKEIHRASRHHRSLAVLMMDVDRFKQYNDSYGHLAGDQVLRGMGIVIEDATREADVPARYGGEEFIVLLPDCDLEGAVDAAERIRARLSQEVFEGGAITVSIGAAEYPEHGDTTNALIGAADAALYQAKDGGRDRVVAAASVRAEKVVKDPMAKRRASRKAAPKKKTTAAATKKKPATEKKPT